MPAINLTEILCLQYTSNSIKPKHQKNDLAKNGLWNWTENSQEKKFKQIEKLKKKLIFRNLGLYYPNQNAMVRTHMITINKDVGQGEHIYIVDRTIVQPFWKSAWYFLKKLEINLPYKLTTPFMVIWRQRLDSLIQRQLPFYLQ